MQLLLLVGRKVVVLEIAVAAQVDVEEVVPRGIDDNAAFANAMAVPRADDAEALTLRGGDATRVFRSRAGDVTPGKTSPVATTSGASGCGTNPDGALEGV